jgi:predicted dehydrogenase/threonine dehydrogenase-like Zn-dependent dehydrogenase
MKQILQSLKNGKIEIASIPCPEVRPGHLLIRSSRSLVSAGTERMLLDFGKASYINKARQQPDKVRMVLEKIKADGLMPTIEAVFSKLDQPLPLGYCNVGEVIEVGQGVSGFSVGDRVASNGKHAEVVSVPANLCAKISDLVTDDAAAFTVVGSIALQGIRLAMPTLGETFVVTGLGLIGLLAVQLLRANGCRVLGIDYDRAKMDLARRFGAEVVDLSAGGDVIAAADTFSRGRGVDGVLITAATKSNEPVHQAAQMCRKRGRIILVGVAGLELARSDFYAKELSFQVSCSYGPGRYDSNYEEKGNDYPIGYVRWTEQRNFEAVLDMIHRGSLDTTPLVSHRFPFSQANDAYALLSGEEQSLGILFDYTTSDKKNAEELQERTVKLVETGDFKANRVGNKPIIGFIGAGNYASRILIPAFQKTGACLRTIASSGGVSAVHVGRKLGVWEATTDSNRILCDPDINAVTIVTQHNTHAHFVREAINAGKHVFVEKPLCLTLEELAGIRDTYNQRTCSGYSQVLMIGFNRRFAPHTQRIKAMLSGLNMPKTFIMTVNAGSIPADHWTQDRLAGGGRIVGEACHFIDLLRYLADSVIEKYSVMKMDTPTGDTVSINLRFADGSLGTIHYFANGSKSFPKERLEVFVSGRILQLDNFRKLTGFGWPGFNKMNLWGQNKGQEACVAAFVKAVATGGCAPIFIDDIMEVSRVSIELAEMALN